MDPEPATLRTTPANAAAVESAGIKKLKIYHMENTKKEINRLRKKLRKLKKILLTNVEIWDETQHDPVEEFKLLVDIIDEK
jgi:acetyl-CoA carboxylase alpha subunit